MTINGLDEPVAVIDPGLDVTVYPVIDDPPVPFAEKDTVACALPPVAEDKVGACGTVVAVTPLLADDALDVPIGPAAVTV